MRKCHVVYQFLVFYAWCDFIFGNYFYVWASMHNPGHKCLLPDRPEFGLNIKFDTIFVIYCGICFFWMLCLNYSNKHQIWDIQASNLTKYVMLNSQYPISQWEKGQNELSKPWYRWVQSLTFWEHHFYVHKFISLLMIKHFTKRVIWCLHFEKLRRNVMLIYL